MGEPLGVAIIGLGTIGRLHLDAARRLGARVVGVSSSGEARARRVEAELGVPAVGDYRRLLDDPSVQVVHICTPNYLHYSIAREALAAGKHVLCEKPLTLTSLESEDLLRRALASRLVHAVGFNNRFYPLVREARAQVEQGMLGRVFAVRGFILEDSLLSPDVYEWRLDPTEGGESVAMSTIGCHLVDLVGFVAGSTIASVCADFATVHPVRRRAPARPNGRAARPTGQETVACRGEEVANVLVRFASGALGVIGVSRATAGRRYRVALEVDGTEAALAWDSEQPNQLWRGRDRRPNEVVLRDPALLTEAARPYARFHGAYQEAFPDTVAALARAVYRRVVEGGAGELDVPTFVDGHAAMLVHEAVMASARGRAWVDVASPSADADPPARPARSAP